MADFMSIHHFDVPNKGSDLELKACPFCGSNDVVYAEYERDKVGKRWEVVCLNCLAEIDPGWAQQKSTVQEMWNKRA